MPADAAMPITVSSSGARAITPGRTMSGARSASCRTPPASPARSLACGDGWAQFYGGNLDIELFRGETEGYLTNLSQDLPVVYVVLRRNEESDGLDFQPFLATVCPYEAMGYTSGGDDIVEGVPMPPPITAWVREFVARHHVDVPFVKRKNKRHRDDEGGTTTAIAGRAPS